MTIAVNQYLESIEPVATPLALHCRSRNKGKIDQTLIEFDQKLCFYYFMWSNFDIDSITAQIKKLLLSSTYKWCAIQSQRMNC